MIGKCKAIAHGNNALEYIFREGKLGKTLLFHNLCGTTPKEIYEEMKMVSDYNTRCRNKFLRIEIGIAPQDEKRLNLASVRNLASNFAIRMELANHQWVAVTHKDTDNMHIHIIANRISLYGEVYDTTFVSNRAARVAEELSRKYGLTIAKEVKAERAHQKAKANPTREQMKQQVQQICYALLDKYKGGGISGYSMFLFVLVMRGRRPRGAWGTVSGAASAFTAAGSAMAAVCCISVAGTSFFRPRPLFSLFSAGAPSEAENPAIFSISSRFFNVVSPIPIAFAISRSSTRLFPSSAFKSCIYFYFKVIFRTPAGAGTLEFACKDSALFRNSK